MKGPSIQIPVQEEQCSSLPLNKVDSNESQEENSSMIPKLSFGECKKKFLCTQI